MAEKNFRDHMETVSRIASFQIPFSVVVLIYGLSFWIVIFVYFHFYNFPVYEITLPNYEGEAFVLEYGPQMSLQDELYFNDVKEIFIKKESSFIVANLEKMTMQGYKGGEKVLEFPIAAKGQDGTWTETPAGLYRVEWKTESHHSSLYGVTMPYSVQFFGNYFIHGWPYHPDGRAVASPVSAGCIRLETENAQELYDIARVGMPVLVFEKGYSRDDFAYFGSVGDISAEKYLLVDLKSDFVFSRKGSDEPFSIKGLSKLPLGLIAGERHFIGSNIIVPEIAVGKKTYKPRFKVGEEVTLYTLLAVLLSESSNEASHSIITHMGNSNTASLLNNHLYSLGMQDTHIKDPSGHIENVSTLRDLVSLSKYLYFNRMSLLEISRGKLNSVYLNPNHNDITPNHSLKENVSFAGGFIPHDGEDFEGVSLAIFEMEVHGEKRPIAIIVAGSSNPAEDILKLFDSVRLTSD